MAPAPLFASMAFQPTVAPTDLTISSVAKSYLVHHPILLNPNNCLKLLEQHNNCKNFLGLLLYAKVYVITEKYAINSLKDLADDGDFLDAAGEAYTSIIETDRGLRDVIMEVFAKHEDLLDRDEAKTLVMRLGSLAYDLLVHFYREGKLWY
ncbi:uncharacterized protein GLRG_05994 [Colletotrichum graminicola M1.001]|uniref:Uncharacterized protein n=1 Tax=Colletotrichum graminicola (strain M1.001 / M2 / FGSC 10212) TaxID=645133 RepID=E3QJ12_COLGM|nr:uncharacterized protein GLRG_05994 [Colletotrichum graminicola M1.001]EFQ30850.1 hypothetical protein GLRG_05994 [Colletotrichum graminicola M1.001]